MMLIQCPKCSSKESIEAGEPGSIFPCSHCGQKLRIPARIKPGSEGEIKLKPDSEQIALALPIDKRPYNANEKGRSPQPMSSPGRHRAQIEDANGSGKPEFSIERRQKQRALKDLADAADLDPMAEPSSRKRRRKKKGQAGTVSPHTWLTVGAICAICILTFVFWKVYRSAISGQSYDSAAVIAELEQAGALFERDQQIPGNPVVSVNLSNRHFEGHILGGLVSLPHLRKLDLSSTNTSDITLEWIENVKSLQVLILNRTKITAGGMQFLKNLENLEELDLSQTIVTDRALISDHGLFELEGLKKLKVIDLEGTMAQGWELQQKIPGLKVIRDRAF
jgi:hypothetical protein